jgi:hypothetical protein
MLLIEHGPRGAVDVSRRKPTWVIYDGKRVAKFQFVGDRGRGGYFTLVPVDKSGAQPRTEYLTHRTITREATTGPPKGAASVEASGSRPSVP